MFSRLSVIPALVWLAVLFLAPLVVVVAASFARRGMPLDWAFSSDAWRSMMDPSVLKVLGRTLWFSILTTAGALLLGAPLAWFIARRETRQRRVLLALVLLPLIANSLVIVYAWMNLLDRQGLAGRALIGLGVVPEGGQILYTGAASLLGMIYYYLPFMVYPICMALEKMDWRLVEAAADLGASGRQSLWHIVLPLVWPGVAAGGVLVFIQATGTFVIPDLMGGGKDMLAGTMISQRFVGQASNWPAGSALSVLIMLVMAAGLVVYFKLQRRILK
jgi:spermidine/putrescine transport system permease protein